MQKIPACFVVLGFCLLPAQADRNIGINFNNNDGASAQAAFTTQGATWTDINPLTGNTTAMGAGFSVEWGAANYWRAGSWNDGDGVASSAADKEIGLYFRYLDDGDTPDVSVPADLGQAGDGIGVAVRLSGLSAWLAAEGADGYRITVYCSTDSTPATFRPVSVREGGALTSPVVETITPPVLGDGIYPFASGNSSGGKRGNASFGGFFTQDTVMITVAARSGDARGTLAAIRVEAVDAARSVLDAGGTWGEVAGDALFSAIGQGQPVGYFAGAGNQLHAGFLNTFLMHPELDTDGDLVADENDTDDDGDGISDLGELAGTGFNPVTATDPLKKDSDEDGVDDGSEAIAGTNPGDTDSLLAITTVEETAGVVTVHWNSRSGKQYRLWRAPTVGQLGAAVQVGGVVTASGGTGPWLETGSQALDAPLGDHAVYRVEVLP